MDWIALSTSIVTLLTWFVTRVGEGAGQKVGEEIYLLLLSRFKGNKEANSMLQHFTNNPERYKAVMISILQEAFEEDPQFARVLQDTLEKSNYKQPREENTTQIVNGDGNILQKGKNNTAFSRVNKRRKKS